MPWTVPDKGEGDNDIQSILFQEYLEVLVAGISGLDAVISGCEVTGGADMTPAVAAGVVLSNGVVRIVAAGDVTIGAADATNPRLDLIVVDSSGAKQVRAGTAAAAPKPPARTANDVVLAVAYVPATDTTIATTQLTDLRVMRSVALPVYHLIRANVDRTLTSNTNLQAIFNSPANGRLTLTTGFYKFEGMLLVTAMSGTSGNALINPLGAGTATIASWLWNLHGLDNSTTTTIADDDSAFYQAAATAASAVAAGTGTAMRARFNGTFEVTTGGTLIPSIQLVTAASAVIQDGSFFMVERLGEVDLVSVGAWD